MLPLSGSSYNTVVTLIPFLSIILTRMCDFHGKTFWLFKPEVRNVDSKKSCDGTFLVSGILTRLYDIRFRFYLRKLTSVCAASSNIKQKYEYNSELTTYGGVVFTKGNFKRSISFSNLCTTRIYLISRFHPHMSWFTVFRNLFQVIGTCTPGVSTSFFLWSVVWNFIVDSIVKMPSCSEIF